MKKLLHCILVGSLVLTMLLTGCGSSQAKTDSATKQESVDGIQYGQILSVSDSEIVLALGTLDQKTSSGDGSEQTPPEKPTGSAVQAPSGDKAPQGDGSGSTPPEGKTPPQGNPPSDGTTSSGIKEGSHGRSMIELTGDKLTIAVSSNTSVTYMRAEGDTSDTTATLSDLKEGDIIAVTVDEDGKTALEITIMAMQNPGTPPATTDSAKSTDTNSEE